MVRSEINKFGMVIGLFVLSMVLFSGTSIVTAKTKKTTLKAITVFDPARSTVKGMTKLADKVKKISGGKVIIKIIGGPEVVPIPEQPNAVSEGMIDMLLTFTTTYEDRVPQTIPLARSKWTPKEERDSGFKNWLNTKIMKGANMYYLCRAQANYGFYTFSNVEIKKRSDFKRLKLGVSPLWIPFVKKAEAVPVLIDEPNLYTAMSRGTIDGFVVPPDATRGLGLHEVTKYIVGPKFYQSSNILITINLDKWNRLDKETQSILIKAGVELEDEIGSYYAKTQKEDVSFLLNSGMQQSNFSAKDRKWYLDTWDEVLWQKAKEKNSDADYNELVKYLR